MSQQAASIKHWDFGIHDPEKGYEFEEGTQIFHIFQRNQTFQDNGCNIWGFGNLYLVFDQYIALFEPYNLKNVRKVEILFCSEEVQSILWTLDKYTEAQAFYNKYDL